MKAEYMNLAASLREGSYIWRGDSVVGVRPATKMEIKAAEAIESLVKCMAVTDDHWRQLADELNAYNELGTIEHLRTLVAAEKEKRLRIIPVRKYHTCGTCQHFVRTEGKTYGTCKVRNSVLYQIRKACSKEYMPREAEADVAE